MPDNKGANLLARRVADAVGHSTWELISTIVLSRGPEEVDPKAFLPRSRYFRDYNQVHFRSDWGREALAAFIEARWQWGHIHEDIGAFTLWSHGRFWALDSGYGIPASEAHNLVIVDGKGMPRRAAGGEMLQYFDSKLATLAEADAARSWSEAYSGHFDWLSTYKVDSMARARRVFCVLWADEDLGIPPYVAVLDDIQKDGSEHRYEWLMGTWPDHRIEIGEHRATLSAPFNDRWLEGPNRPMDWSESHRHWIEHTLTTPTDGDYEVWVFCRGSDDWGGDYVNCWLNGKSAGYMPLSGPTWRWVKISRKRVSLKAGACTVKIDQRGSKSPVRLKWVAVTCDADFAPVEPRLYHNDTTVSAELDGGTKLVGEWRWVEGKKPTPCLDVHFLNPSVSLRQDLFIGKGRWHKEVHPRLRALSESVNPRFLALLYPRTDAVPPLQTKCFPNRYGYPHEIHWPHAIDYVGDYTHRKSSGKGVTYGSDAQFFLVRVPTNDGVRPVSKYAGQSDFVPDTKYLMVNGNQLDFEGKELVGTEGLARYGCVATVARSGDELMILARTGLHAQWQVERNGTVRAYGPDLTTVVVNGKPAQFTREQEYVVVRVRTQVFVATRQKVTERIRARYEEIQ